MATQNKVAVIPVKTLHGGPPLQRWYPEAASQTFKRGEAVYLDGNGRMAEFTLGIDTGGQRWLGFAAEDAHNDTTAATHRVSAYLGWGTIFEINESSNGSDVVSVITHVGTLYPLYHDATLNISFVDIADTAGTLDSLRVISVDKDGDGSAGDTNARVWVMIIDSALQVVGN